MTTSIPPSYFAEPSVLPRRPTAAPDLLEGLACPKDKQLLDAQLHCASCNTSYPRVNGVPVLLHEDSSVFRIADYVQRPSQTYGGASAYGGHMDRQKGWRLAYHRFIRSLTEAPIVGREFDVHAAVRAIRSEWPDARVLVIGAGDSTAAGDAVYTDVAFGRGVNCIADAHDLPFVDASFDACIASAVMEHVVDPQRCVAEIQRVLRPLGFVYAETPFMHPVHMGAHDFTRFTFLGHRRLFRWFDDVASGMAGGPAMGLTLALRYTLLSAARGPWSTKLLRMAGIVFTHPVRALDHFAKRSPAAYDAAAGFLLLWPPAAGSNRRS